MIATDTHDYVQRLYAAGLDISTAHIMALSAFEHRARNNGYWSKLIEFYPFCGKTETAARRKLKYVSGETDVLAGTNGEWLAEYYSERGGYSPTGNSNLTLSAGLNPSEIWDDQVNDCMFAWYDSPSGASNNYQCGCFDTGGQALSARRSTSGAGILTVNMGSASFVQPAISASQRAFFVCNRTASDLYRVFADGSQIGSDFSHTASVVSEQDWRVMGRVLSSPTNQQTLSRQAFSMVGEGFTDANVTDLSADAAILVSELRRA